MIVLLIISVFILITIYYLFSNDIKSKLSKLYRLLKKIIRIIFVNPFHSIFNSI